MITVEEHKRKSIEDYLKFNLGDPIVAAVTEETDAIQSAINVSLERYWTCFPHEWMNVYTSKAQGTVIDTVDNLMNMAFMGNPDAQEKAYFLGVTRIEDGALGAIGNNIDSYLLGVFYPNPSYKVYPGALDLAEIVRYRTEVGIITGEIEVHYDHVTGLSKSPYRRLLKSVVTVLLSLTFHLIGLKLVPLLTHLIGD